MPEQTYPVQQSGKSNNITSMVKNFSLGEKIIGIGAVAGIVSFFLTWFSYPDDFAESMDISEEVTGMDIAGWAYLIPALMIVSLVILYLSSTKGSRAKVKFSSIQIFIGTVVATLGITIYQTLSSVKEWISEEMGDAAGGLARGLTKEMEEISQPEIGFWIFIAGALAIIVGAYLVQKRNLKE